MGQEFKPFTAYHSIADGMNHYYFQRPDCVIHINQESVLINQLEVSHLAMLEPHRIIEEISTDRYLSVAAEVQNQLGFVFYHTLPLIETRQN